MRQCGEKWRKQWWKFAKGYLMQPKAWQVVQVSPTTPSWPRCALTKTNPMASTPWLSPRKVSIISWEMPNCAKRVALEEYLRKFWSLLVSLLWEIWESKCMSYHFYSKRRHYNTATLLVLELPTQKDKRNPYWICTTALWQESLYQ